MNEQHLLVRERFDYFETAWAIPVDAEKPVDKRIKSDKYVTINSKK